MVESEQTLEDNQQKIDLGLKQLDKTRKLKEDGTEFVFMSEYAEARQDLLRLLYDLPSEVACLVIDVNLPPCPNNPEEELDYLNRGLREKLDKLFPSVQNRTESTTISLIVRPPRMPEELKRIHFGSQARTLSEEVLETVRMGERGSIALMEISPLGEPKTSPSKNNNVIDLLVPLIYIQKIKLEKEEKQLTPYLERNPQGSLAAHPVNYS